MADSDILPKPGVQILDGSEKLGLEQHVLRFVYFPNIGCRKRLSRRLEFCWHVQGKRARVQMESLPLRI